MEGVLISCFNRFYKVGKVNVDEFSVVEVTAMLKVLALHQPSFTTKPSYPHSPPILIFTNVIRRLQSIRNPKVKLELRILTHLAGCKSMLDTFEAGACQESTRSSLKELRSTISAAKTDVRSMQQNCQEEADNLEMLNFSIAYGKIIVGLTRDWKFRDRAGKVVLQMLLYVSCWKYLKTRDYKSSGGSCLAALGFISRFIIDLKPEKVGLTAVSLTVEPSLASTSQPVLVLTNGTKLRDTNVLLIGRKRFNFEPMWLRADDFPWVVKNAWMHGLSMGLGADPTSLLVACGKKLQNWNWSKNSWLQNIVISELDEMRTTYVVSIGYEASASLTPDLQDGEGLCRCLTPQAHDYVLSHGDFQEHGCHSYSNYRVKFCKSEMKVQCSDSSRICELALPASKRPKQQDVPKRVRLRESIR
nr:calponin-like domain-containing protein [Tanacetum cinerariifolium]